MSNAQFIDFKKLNKYHRDFNAALSKVIVGVDFDSNCGATRIVHPVLMDHSIYATPFYDGELGTLSIQVNDDEEGNYEHIDSVEFNSTGDIDKDVELYIELVENNLGTNLPRKPNLDIRDLNRFEELIGQLGEIAAELDNMELHGDAESLNKLVETFEEHHSNWESEIK